MRGTGRGRPILVPDVLIHLQFVGVFVEVVVRFAAYLVAPGNRILGPLAALRKAAVSAARRCACCGRSQWIWGMLENQRNLARFGTRVRGGESKEMAPRWCVCDFH